MILSDVKCLLITIMYIKAKMCLKHLPFNSLPSSEGAQVFCWTFQIETGSVSSERRAAGRPSSVTCSQLNFIKEVSSDVCYNSKCCIDCFPRTFPLLKSTVSLVLLVHLSDSLPDWLEMSGVEEEEDGAESGVFSSVSMKRSTDRPPGFSTEPGPSGTK